MGECSPAVAGTRQSGCGTRRTRSRWPRCTATPDSSTLGKGYRVLQVDNRTVKEYREKVFGLETKTDDVDARLMARMGFLHEMVGEEFSIQPVHLVDGDAAALRVMVRDLEKL